MKLNDIIELLKTSQEGSGNVVKAQGMSLEWVLSSMMYSKMKSNESINSNSNNNNISIIKYLQYEIRKKGDVIEWLDIEQFKHDNLNGYLFLRFVYVSLYFIVGLCVICIPILVGVNYGGGGDCTGMDVISMSNIKDDNSYKYVFHFGAATGVVLWFHYVYGHESRFLNEIKEEDDDDDIIEDSDVIIPKIIKKRPIIKGRRAPLIPIKGTSISIIGISPRGWSNDNNDNTNKKIIPITPSSPPSPAFTAIYKAFYTVISIIIVIAWVIPSAASAVLAGEISQQIKIFGPFTSFAEWVFPTIAFSTIASIGREMMIIMDKGVRIGDKNHWMFLFDTAQLIMVVFGGSNYDNNSNKNLNFTNNLLERATLAGNFFMAYFVVRGLTVLNGATLRGFELIKYLVINDDNTTDKLENTYCSSYAAICVAVCVTLLTSITAPIVLLFAAIHATLVVSAQTFWLGHVNVKKCNKGGLQQYRDAILHVKYGLYYMLIFLIAVFTRVEPVLSFLMATVAIVSYCSW
ncbi:hypothetical protein DAPK24_041340 [Pichia kluyveri]|uniref:Amino acid transporter transmembrane domain-containing protein n=1 Tax=Pichia kluyveri TaxID=36015 RepID=A0AAV5R7N9_PICKL|nr:hypothetical protein DAPK24_041340 [Pichia kluyveri]